MNYPHSSKLRNAESVGEKYCGVRNGSGARTWACVKRDIEELFEMQ